MRRLSVFPTAERASNQKKLQKNREKTGDWRCNRRIFAVIKSIRKPNGRHVSLGSSLRSGRGLTFRSSSTPRHWEVETTMAKKTATKAAPAPAKSDASGGSHSKAATKGEIYGSLSEKTGLGKKEISKIFDALSELIAKELGKKGPGQFVVPGLLKLKVVRKPATKAKQGINPFTKEPMMIKAKPARNVVKAVPMKALKELV
jgi:nucleoid DNA-binding protein